MNNNIFNLSGTILYNPHRAELGTSDKNKIVILDVPSGDFPEYCQWFILKKYGLKTQSPMFGTHVTIVRPYEINENHPLWKKYQSKKIDIEINIENLERHWQFWSITIFSPEIKQIRKELNLRTDYRLHMTVARQYDWQPKPILENVIHDTDYP